MTFDMLCVSKCASSKATIVRTPSILSSEMEKERRVIFKTYRADDADVAHSQSAAIFTRSQDKLPEGGGQSKR